MAKHRQSRGRVSIDMSFMNDPSKAAAVHNAESQLGFPSGSLASVIGRESSGRAGLWGGKNNRHYGLIQFGPAERKQYGVTIGMSFEAQVQGPVVRYMQDRFAKAGMSTQGATLSQIYAAVLTGTPRGNVHASDGNTTVASSLRALQEAATKVGGFIAQTGTEIASAADTAQRTVRKKGREIASSTADFARHNAEAQSASLTAEPRRRPRRQQLAEMNEKPSQARSLQAPQERPRRAQRTHTAEEPSHHHRYASSHRRHYAEGEAPKRHRRYSARARVAESPQFQQVANDFGNYFREQAKLRGEAVLAAPQAPKSRHGRSQLGFSTPIRNEPNMG